MSLRIGDMSPDFSALTTLGVISFHEYLGADWGVLFSHPGDFTPVCTTEVGRMAQLREKFASRNVKVIGLSVDSVTEHDEWVADIEETQHTTVSFPIIADENRNISTLYDMIHPGASVTATVRSLFVISPDKRIKLIISYPASTGRNFEEVLRVIDSLQLTDKYSVATPADWKMGAPVLVSPALSLQDANRCFPAGVTELRPYLRFTPQP